MGQLKVQAINPVLVTGWLSLVWVVRGLEWEFTCGFCRNRLRRVTWMFASSIDCPACGTRNVVRTGWMSGRTG
jgi:hypothetical protein